VLAGVLRISSATATRHWLTLGVIVSLVAVRLALSLIVRGIGRLQPHERLVFWTDQGASLAALIILIAAGMTIWVDDPARPTSIVASPRPGSRSRRRRRSPLCAATSSRSASCRRASWR
jgi:hypothetical protein